MNLVTYNVSKIVIRRKSNVSFQHIIRHTKSSFPKPLIDAEYITSVLNELVDDKQVRNQEIVKCMPTNIREFLNTKKINCKNIDELIPYVSKLPNIAHPDIKHYKKDFETLKTVGTKQRYPFDVKNGTELLLEKDLLQMTGMQNICGERSYFFIGDLVKLEQALIHYTVQKLLEKGFNSVLVPDILCDNVIESCGMPTEGVRTQVYKLKSDVYGSGWCLSGTSEMAIAALFSDCNLNEETLPLYYTATSRCYRAEISDIASEKGIYRVHQFTKVEMFGICLPHESDSVLELFRSIQEELFSSFGLHYRVIDMSPHELGRQACRKFDIEAWLPGMNRFGEISSCSNCGDYQARRLNIRSGEKCVHTVNGTACAVPRTVNAIAETHQIEKGRIKIPESLQQIVGMDVLGMKRGPNLHRIKRLPKTVEGIPFYIL